MADGHEIGVHGYSHENPIAMSRTQEADILDFSIDLVTDRTGTRPTGYVAPWWEFSPVTNELLIERGIRYDHSLMHRDFEPYYVRVGDSWTKINYDEPAATWMKPLVRGHETDLVEIPASWYLDDLPPMMFIKSSPNSHGFVNPVTSKRCGETSSTGSTASRSTRSSPSRSTPTCRVAPRCC